MALSAVWFLAAHPQARRPSHVRSSPPSIDSGLHFIINEEGEGSFLFFFGDSESKHVTAQGLVLPLMLTR